MSCMQDQQARHYQKCVKTPAHKNHPDILKFSMSSFAWGDECLLVKDHIQTQQYSILNCNQTVFE